MSDYRDTLYPFRPVRCVESKLKDLDSVDGYVYFTTDTQKLFLGQNGNKIEMCGYNGIYYGNKTIEYTNDGQTPNPDITFLRSEIEGDKMPEPDDLILNKDGNFYKVISIEYNNNIKTIRITLQGHNIDQQVANKNFNISVEKTNYACAADAKIANIKFKCSSLDSSNYIKHVYLGFGNNASDISTNLIMSETNIQFPLDTEYTIDLRKYEEGWSKFALQKTTPITLELWDKYDNVRSFTFYIYIAVLSLEMVSNPLFIIYNEPDDNIDFVCNIEGDALDKKVIKYVFHKEGADNPLTPIIKEIPSSVNGDQPMKFNPDGLDGHGVYTLSVYAEGYAGGSLITSNTLIHKVLRYDRDEGTPLLGILIDEYIEQHTDIPVQFLLAGGNSILNYPMKLDLYGHISATEIGTVELGTFNLKPGELSEQLLAPIELTGEYQLQCFIQDLNVEKEQRFNIKEYTGLLPVVDGTRSDLILYLTPKGKSNALTNKNEWKSSHTESTNDSYTAQLENFFYGQINGWSTEEFFVSDDETEKVNYLKLNQGAKLTVPGFRPYGSKKLAKNGGITIELDFKVLSVLDYTKELIKCYAQDKDGTIFGGFAIYANEARFYTKNLNTEDSCIKFNLIDGERVKLTFKVEAGTTKYPMILTYLNGIVSNATNYSPKTDGITTHADVPEVFTVDSTAAEIHLYGVRFYSSALDEATILNNVEANLPTKAERTDRYLQNLVYDAKGKISLKKIQDLSYDLRIPYITISGGYACDKKFVMAAESQANVARLPQGKKDYRLIDFDIYYPKTYEQKDFSSKTVFEDGSTIFNGFGKKPKTGAAMMYAQGTSSLEYPVKNLRIKWQDQTIQVTPDTPAVELVCLKADYMESSGSHNTGAANMIDDLYVAMGMKTPGQEFFGDEVVTCIKGHPCIIFYNSTGREDDYEYIGKYNLNLDKATAEPFGFVPPTKENELPSSNIVDMETKKKLQFGYLLNDKGELEIINGKKINAVHCFEFLDNAVKVCNFLPEDDAKEGDKEPFYAPYALIVNDNKEYQNKEYYYFNGKDYEIYKTDLNPSEEEPLQLYVLTEFVKDKYWHTWYDNAGWTKGFESRYPEDMAGTYDADALYPLAHWIYELWNLYNTKDENNNSDKKSQELAKARFAREYHRFFDKDFIMAYFLITETLLMVDSRVKNMMIATWGKSEKLDEYDKVIDLDENYKPILSKEKGQSREYKWYPIFYDMDTMLGLNNEGKQVYEYHTMDTDGPTIYNGEEALWVLFRESLQPEIKDAYNSFERTGMWYAQNILTYFNTLQADVANEAFYNGDASYKYIRPFREGYKDHLNDTTIAPGTAPYLYAAQGNRSLDREYFLKNRINFLQGKYASDAFQNSDSSRIAFRVTCPSYQDIPEDATEEKKEEIRKTNLSVAGVPASGEFEFTPLKTGYAGAKIGQNGVAVINKFDGKNSQLIDTTKDFTTANGTEGYIFGFNILSSFGDLSDKYIGKFVMPISEDSDNMKLTHIKLGNDYKDYYNVNWKNQPSMTLNCSSLETFDLMNCSEYTKTIDLSGSPYIQNVYLNGSGVTSLVLPIGGMLKELRLPTTIKSLDINSHSGLTDNGFTIGYYDYDNGNQMRIDKDNPTWVNDYSKLTEISIIDTPIDTYNMITQASSLNRYCLNGINWTITGEEQFNDQYCYSGIEISSNKEEYKNKGYYIYINSEYIEYIEDYEFDEKETVKLYQLISLISIDENDNKYISAIPVLDYLNGKTPITGIKDNALMGNIKLCVFDAKADEFALYQRYIMEQGFKGINIEYDKNMQVDEAYRIKFYASADFNKNSIPFYTALGNGTEKAKLQHITTENVKKGPVKSSNNSYDYKFKYWVVCESEDQNFPAYDVTNKFNYGEGYQEPTDIDEKSIITNTEFDNTIFNGNVSLVPVYEQITRYYTIKLYSYEQENPKLLLTTEKAEYGKSVRWALENEYGKDNEALLQMNYIYRAYDNLPDPKTGIPTTNRYVLNGWQTQSQHDYSPGETEWTNVGSELIKGNFIGYAVYRIENYLTVATDSRYIITEDGQVSFNPVYKNVFEDVVTLPIVDKNNEIIHTIGDFTGTKIQEIYTLSGAMYTTISKNAFEGQSYLTTIQLPKTIKNILDSAFQNCANLVDLGALSDDNIITNVEKIDIEAFNNVKGVKINLDNMLNLTSIGVSAFNGCKGTGVKVSEKLPSGIKELKGYTFGGCSNVKITDFTQFITIGNNGYPVLSGCGAEVSEIRIKAYNTMITDEEIKKTVVVNNGAFSGYGNLSTVIFIYDSGETFLTETQLSQMGFGDVTYIHQIANY